MDENKIMDNEIETNNSETHCSKCGAVIAEGQQFCPNCGKKVSVNKKNPRFVKRVVLIAAVALISVIAIIFGGIKLNERIQEKKLIEEVKKNPNTPHEHVWIEATCTEPIKCALCGKTKGFALGHDITKWERTKEPTCEQDGIQEGVCNRCGETLQKPLNKLGHRWNGWRTVKEATCDEKGVKERTCNACGAVEQADIPKLAHEWEEGEIVVAARYNAPGKKKYTCRLCGKIEEKEYNASPEEYETTYKEDCKKYTYDQIARDPDDYKGKMGKFTGEVIQVLEDGNRVHMRIDITKTRWGYIDTIYVVYTKKAGESRILEDDIVTIWGKLDGTYTYESIFGQEITLPLFWAEYLTVN